MSLEEFEESLAAEQPPEMLSSSILIALWHEGKGDWAKAHDIAQSREGVADYDRLHAYLHRVEGDEWNAGYWYRRSGEKFPEMALKDEWRLLVQKMLN